MKRQDFSNETVNTYFPIHKATLSKETTSLDNQELSNNTYSAFHLVRIALDKDPVATKWEDREAQTEEK